MINSLRIKLKRPRTIISVLFLSVLTFSLVKNIARIQGSGSRIDREQENVEELKEEQKELEERLKIVQSEEYVEKQLRDKLGLAKEGEIVIVLPEDDILRKLAPVYEEEEETLPDPNWKKWLNLFL